MAYNLTEKQKSLARWIAETVRSGNLDETFLLMWGSGLGDDRHAVVISGDGAWTTKPIDPGSLETLVTESLIKLGERKSSPFPKGVKGYAPPYLEMRCVLAPDDMGRLATEAEALRHFARDKM